MTDRDGVPNRGTLSASSGFELFLLGLVAIPFYIVLADAGTVAVGPTVVAAAAGVGWGMLAGRRGGLGFGRFGWAGRTALLVGLFGLVAGTVVLLQPDMVVYASVSLGLLVGLASVRVGRIVQDR